MQEQQSETTGQHPVQHAAGMLVPPNPPSTWKDRLLVLVLALVLGGGGGLATSAADSARQDQRVTELERRVGSVENALREITAMRQDLAALSARVDAWRTSDIAARASRAQSVDQRIERLEEHYYRRSR